MPARRRFFTIVLGTIAWSCILGVCLDFVTANVAVEYFTVHHPRILSTENSWVLAVFWGVAASWWFGAIAGVIVAYVNHRRPSPLPPKQILRWVMIACVVLWIVMIATLAAVLAITNMIPLDERRPTFEHDRRLIGVAVAHQFEYLLGAIAALVIAIMTWRAKNLRNDKPAQLASE